MALLPSWWPLLQTTAWRPGGLLVRPRWVGEGAAELKVCVSSCNAGVNTADGKGREGETAEPYPSPPPGPPPPPYPVLWPDEAVTMIMTWKLDCGTITPASHGAPEAQEEQKTPEFPSCALAENHTAFPSALQLLCRSSAQTTGLKRERVSSKTLLLPLRSTWLSLRSSWKPHSRSSPPGG